MAMYFNVYDLACWRPAVDENRMDASRLPGPGTKSRKNTPNQGRPMRSLVGVTFPIALILAVVLAPLASASWTQTYTPPYPGGCAFSSPLAGSITVTKTTNAYLTFNTANYSTGTGGLDAGGSAAASKFGGHSAALGGSYIVPFCPWPAGSSSGTHFHVALTYSVPSSATASTSCVGSVGSSATANASIMVYLYGGTPAGTYGTTSHALYSYSTGTCGSFSHSGTYIGVLTSGSVAFGPSDFFSIYFIAWSGASETASPTGSTATSDSTISFTISQIQVIET